MGRAGLIIDKAKLSAVLTELESQRTFENRSRLFEAVCATPWAKTIVNTVGRSHSLTTANVHQYVNKYGLSEALKTPVGKRGNPNIGVKLTPEQRKKKISQRAGFLKTINRLKADIFNHFGCMPESKLKLLNKAAAGNKSAIIKLKCLECCCWQASEAAQCTVYGCPLILVNPFIKPAGSPPEGDDVDDEVADE